MMNGSRVPRAPAAAVVAAAAGEATAEQEG